MSAAKSKTEVVRTVLLARLKAEEQRTPLPERLQEAQKLADEIGSLDPEFDMKTLVEAALSELGKHVEINRASFFSRHCRASKHEKYTHECENFDNYLNHRGNSRP